MLRSDAVTKGIQRSPNRAMLRAVGFGDEDFGKPILGIANGYSTITPCNVGLNDLSRRAEEAARQAGGMPQMFGTITVSDGISMGTEGMKYSLVSREVIADAIETACNGQSMDGVLAVGGCDKNMPGAMLAMARMNIPAVFVYGGTIKPGKLGGCDLTVVSAFEAVGQLTSGNIDEDQLTAVEKNACPGAGSCGGMFTANTMSAAIETMGLSLPYSSTMAAEDEEKADSAARSAEVLLDAVKANIRPLDLLTKDAFENAFSVIMAVGGSTNAVLHLLAPAEHTNRNQCTHSYAPSQVATTLVQTSLAQCSVRSSLNLASTTQFHSTFIRSKNKVELDHFYLILNTWTLLRLVYVDDAPRFNHRQIISGTSC
jgi:dihydroxy-acid dehydratase